MEIDPWYYHPSEVDLLVGDASKARKKLNWEPKTNFKELVRLMVEADMTLLKDSTATAKMQRSQRVMT